MFSGIAQMAKQALDDMRRKGVDPMVREKAQQESSNRAHAERPPVWLCGLDLGMMTDPTALAIVRKTVEERDDGKRIKRINRYAVLHLQR